MISWLYGAVTKARNALYDRGAFNSISLGAPTVSIGNITVGGTGKTPLVALTAQILAANGEKVCVISRGYKRENPKNSVLVSDYEKVLSSAKLAGDEPFELAQKLVGKAIVIADADRVSAARRARENFNITAFVLDDAFQHRRALRELDIVTIDATNPFGNEKLLPAGILREPLKNLSRADAIVITRANLVKEISNLKSEIKKYNPNCPVFITRNKVSELTEINNFPAKPPNRQETTNKKATAFCALGNPKNFFEQLKSENYNLVSTETFSDHHFYSQNDIEKIEKQANDAGAEILLTTAKDAVKLKNLKFNLPCRVVETEMIFENENEFRELLIKIVKKIF